MNADYAYRYRLLLERMSKAVDDHRASADLNELVYQLNIIQAEAEYAFEQERRAWDDMANELQRGPIGSTGLEAGLTGEGER